MLHRPGQIHAVKRVASRQPNHLRIGRERNTLAAAKSLHKSVRTFGSRVLRQSDVWLMRIDHFKRVISKARSPRTTEAIRPRIGFVFVLPEFISAPGWCVWEKASRRHFFVVAPANVRQGLAIFVYELDACRFLRPGEPPDRSPHKEVSASVSSGAADFGYT
jgi:hypothetical protein